MCVAAIRVNVPLSAGEGFDMDDPNCVARLEARADRYYSDDRGRVVQPDGTTENLPDWLATHW